VPFLECHIMAAPEGRGSHLPPTYIPSKEQTDQLVNVPTYSYAILPTHRSLHSTQCLRKEVRQISHIGNIALHCDAFYKLHDNTYVCRQFSIQSLSELSMWRSKLDITYSTRFSAGSIIIPPGFTITIAGLPSSM